MNFICKNSRYEMGISGLERSKFVFLPVLVVKRFGIC